MRNLRKCFTLIELLVVISIIAILITILLPALKNARELSKRIRCAANLQQMSTAISMYVSDRDGYTPNSRYQYWNSDANKILAYLPNRPPWSGTSYRFSDIFQCPTDTYFPGPTDLNARDWTSYGLSYRLREGVKVARIKNASERIIVSESWHATEYAELGLSSVGAYLVYYTSGYSPMAANCRHLNTGNAAWLDGHVSTLTETDALNVKNKP